MEKKKQYHTLEPKQEMMQNFLITIAMTKICSENYAQQALESYKERRITLFS